MAGQPDAITGFAAASARMPSAAAASAALLSGVRAARNRWYSDTFRATFELDGYS
jgi:hypothetical protein